MQVEEVLKNLSLSEKANLCSGIDMWHTQPNKRLKVPSVMVSDGPNELRKQEGEGDHLGLKESIKAVCFPTASALACSFDIDLLYSLGETLGEECLSEDIAMLLGPGVNMKRSPLCGRNFEYFSEDPYLAGKLGAAYIQGLQSKGVAACVKHFAANNQESYRMSGTSNVDERTLHEIYLPAFEMAVKEGKTRGIMCAYNQINGIFCAESKMLLTDILREMWGFDGLVVTDWGAVKNRVSGLKAGLDLSMPGRDGMDVEAIVEDIKDENLKESDLDNAVRNVLNFISDSGLRQKRAPFSREKDHKASAAFAKECAVLMKNNGVLPLLEDAKVAFIGEFAEKPRYQGGGSSHINCAYVTSSLEAAAEKNIIFARGYDAATDVTDAELLAEAIAAAKNAEVAVVFAGLTDKYESEGFDRTSLAMPACQNELIQRVVAVQPNTVVVLHCGSCVEMPWFDQVAAVLCMHLAGDNAGEATIELLYGKTNPSGKLSETWPLRLQDNPSYLNFPGEEGTVQYREGIFIGYRYYDKKEMPVLLPFGFGLSYTTFEYSNLRLSAEKIEDTQILNATCRIKNTGNVFGKEIVQLYVCDEKSTVNRPVRELKGFYKVALNAGEEKEISFTLDKRSFAYYEPKIHDWYVESGVFRIEIGASSRDIRLTQTIEVEGTTCIPEAYTYSTPLGKVLRDAKGKEIVNQIRAKRAAERGININQPIKEEVNSGSMGASEDKMVSHMIEEMPLSALLSLGGMKKEQLDEIITFLNKK